MVHWRKGLNDASTAERWSLLAAQKTAERVFLQEVVCGLCSHSAIGIAECANLISAASIRRWGRTKGILLATIDARVSPGTYRCTFNWRLNYVRTSRSG